MKIQNKRVDVSKFKMPEIRINSLSFFKAEIFKENKEMFVRIFAVLMEKSPGVLSVIPGIRVSPLAAIEAESDGGAEDGENTSQKVL